MLVMNGQQSGDAPVHQIPSGLSTVTRSGKRSTSSSRQMREHPPQEAPRAIISVRVADGDLPVNPHEPRYCYCNQVSYGTVSASATISTFLNTHNHMIR